MFYEKKRIYPFGENVFHTCVILCSVLSYFQTFLLKRENDINHFFFLSIEIPVEMCLNTYLTLKNIDEIHREKITSWQPALSKWRFTFHEGLFLYCEHQV